MLRDGAALIQMIHECLKINGLASVAPNECRNRRIERQREGRLHDGGRVTPTLSRAARGQGQAQGKEDGPGHGTSPRSASATAVRTSPKVPTSGSAATAARAPASAIRPILSAVFFVTVLSWASSHPNELNRLRSSVPRGQGASVRP